ncbi:MAG: N-acetylglucosamine-6-phosphate deacetylase [Friedmanniella sp.]|nr:N-acetylglucosamine-6-phosphate deacetylase [Friedmanniella sp.]
MTVLAAGRLVTGREVLTPGWVELRAGAVTGVGVGRPARVDQDWPDSVVVPGFVDLHVHGGGGGSFTDGGVDSAVRAVLTHRRHGTTTTLASLVSAGPGELRDRIALLAELVQDGHVAGLHLEGPWISPHRCGAHDPHRLRDPGPVELAGLLGLGDGAVAMVTLAPERPGGLAAVAQVVDAGAIAAIGHTDADYDTVVAAIGAGARVATHLYNAMRPVHHRRPGPVVALLEDPRVTLELVADGTHLHPAVYRQTSVAVGADRVVLATDAMAAAALGDGRFRLGGLAVEVRDGVARVAGTDTLAGGTATMDALFRRAVRAFRSAEDDASSAPYEEADLLRAVRQTSVNPAARLGRTDIGGLEPGRRADLVVLGPDLGVREVWHCGERVPPSG